MKLTVFTAVAGLLTVVSNVAAITVVTPWAQTVWSSGGHGNITWTTTAAEAGLKCDMYLLNGDFKNSNIVAQITDPSTPVDCSIGSYDMHPLNDFASGTYWIRIGQASTGNWAYSAAFQFKGNGTSSPVSVVPSASGVAAAGSANVTAAVPTATGITAKPATNGAAIATAAASKSASAAAASGSAISEGSSSLSVNGVALALSAIAAVAFSL